MFRTGMTTVTFRNRSVEENILFARLAGLNGIEWADKYHVLRGNVETARKVGLLTRESDLRVLSYGSFYNPSLHGIDEFIKTLDCAVALGTDIIRIWPGNLGSEQADYKSRKKITDNIREACLLASEKKITVATEYHPCTLTDTAASTLRLMEEVDCHNCKTYWQMDQNDPSVERGLFEIKSILPYIINLHVFYYRQKEHELSEGKEVWLEWLDLLRTTGKDYNLIIEFVLDDSPESLANDAKTLIDLVRSKK